MLVDFRGLCTQVLYLLYAELRMGKRKLRFFVITLLPTMVVARYFDSRVEHGTCTTHDTPNGCGFYNYNEGE